MPVKLTTTIKKVSLVPNPTNPAVIREFSDYMKQNGSSDNHQNNNLKAILVATFVATMAVAVGIVSAISSASDSYAVSCKNEPGSPCHGCSSFGQGAFASDFLCRHLPSPWPISKGLFQSIFDNFF